MNKQYLYGGIALIIIVTMAVIFTGGDEPKESQTETALKRVATQTVADLAGKQDNITAYGQVVSATGVDVVPETGGIVKAVYRSLGDFVPAGTIVLELQNSSEAQSIAQAQAGVAQAQAQVATAQAGLSSAQNSLAKLEQGADRQVLANAQIAVEQAETNVLQAHDNLDSSLSGILNAAISSLGQSFDPQFFNDPETNPQLKVVTDNVSTRSQLENLRKQTQTQVDQAELRESNNNLSAVGVTAVLSSYEQLINQLRQHITSMSTSKISQFEKDQFNAVLRQANEVVDAQQSQIVSLQNAITNAQLAVTNAQNNLSDLQEGADVLDVSSSANSVSQAQANVLSARAGLSQAQANLRSAQIAYEKTRVRAPVSGRISAIDVRVGDLVGQSASVFSVANQNTLRIDTALSPNEVARIQIGTRVVVDGTREGFVSAISPSVDERTGKVTTQILLRDAGVTLVAGAGVGLELIPEGNASNQNGSNSDVDSRIDTETVLYVPIDAVFVRAGVAYVYVVENSRAVVRSIQTKSLFGDQIEVLSGLELSDRIILNARVVKDNEEIDSIDASDSDNDEAAEAIDNIE